MYGMYHRIFLNNIFLRILITLAIPTYIQIILKARARACVCVRARARACMWCYLCVCVSKTNQAHFCAHTWPSPARPGVRKVHLTMKKRFGQQKILT